MRDRGAIAVFIAVLAEVAAGGALWLSGESGLADAVWALAVALAFLPLAWTVARDLLRGKTGVDLIALLAMAGSLVLGQFLAGAVIGLMLSGGQSLEQYANSRARRELTALLARAPRTVNRYEHGSLVSRPIADVAVGDKLLVKPGEVVPVDGAVLSVAAVLDESALSGESRPMDRIRGEKVRSGAVNAGAPFDVRALTTADESTFTGIIRLVRQAQSSRAPFVRLADRFALWFLPLTLGMAALAWALSGNPVRALAVLVVATPCPLILAAPVAIVAGISRAARRGIIVKGGGALETLARAHTLVFDKTGTLTAGTPSVAAVEAFGSMPPDEVLRLAASLDQVSSHVFAAGIVKAAAVRHLGLELPVDAHERPGQGIGGRVGERHVAVGKARWVSGGRSLSEEVLTLRRRVDMEGLSTVFVASDHQIVGAIVMADAVRTDTPPAIRLLRRSGIDRIVLLSGDRSEVARSVGTTVGADEVLAERTPEAKVEAIRAESRHAITAMVGDGVNDAPALAAADVGIAMGAHGATASSEAADAVIMIDRLDRVVEAIVIARRARTIALQSVVAGMALSGMGMLAAIAGWLPPVAGAVFQEAIDIAVVLNALRALGGPDIEDASPESTAKRRPDPSGPNGPVPVVALPRH